jgi:hypothetical protein
MHDRGDVALLQIDTSFKGTAQVPVGEDAEYLVGCIGDCYQAQAARDMATMASVMAVVGATAGTLSPARMTSRTCVSKRRPREPPGWSGQNHRD